MDVCVEIGYLLLSVLFDQKASFAYWHDVACMAASLRHDTTLLHDTAHIDI